MNYLPLLLPEQTLKMDFLYNLFYDIIIKVNELSYSDKTNTSKKNKASKFM